MNKKFNMILSWNILYFYHDVMVQFLKLKEETEHKIWYNGEIKHFPS